MLFPRVAVLIARRRLRNFLLCLASLLAVPAVFAAPPSAKPISFYHQVRPILQANCEGCHQPAKAKGGYVMTVKKNLLAGGDSEGAAVVPAHPDKSAILKMVTPQDGEVRMPK